jgi:AraC-like DNA-binding protein
VATVGGESGALQPSLPTPLFFSAFVSEAFRELALGISVWKAGSWRAIHTEETFASLGVADGSARLRHLYNQRCLAQVQKTRRPLQAELFGFRDFFVPVVQSRKVIAVIVAGPTLATAPTRASITESWHALTRSPGRLSDPDFSRFVTIALSTLVLDPARTRSMADLLGHLAELALRERESDAAFDELERLRVELLGARFPERMWRAAAEMVDDRTTQAWETPYKRDPLADLGMKRCPQHVIVALEPAPVDAESSVEMLVRSRMLQRAVVAFAQKRGNVVVGRAGEHGISLLVDHPGKGAAARAALLDVVARVQSLAKRSGTKLHAGIVTRAHGGSLAQRFRTALGGAERAVSLGRAHVVVEIAEDPLKLIELRSALGSHLPEQAHLLGARFDRYVEAALVHSGHQLEVLGAHLEAGLDRICEQLLESGLLDRRSYDELSSTLAVSKLDTDSVTALVAAYRHAVREVVATTQEPTTLGQDRSLRRAVGFARQHLAEPLSLARVAKIAGYSLGHFARLFKREHGVSFERYLQGMRLEHAKTMLIETRLDMKQVASRCGFKSRTHFQQLFRDSVGQTPHEYRLAASEPRKRGPN